MIFTKKRLRKHFNNKFIFFLRILIIPAVVVNMIQNFNLFFLYEEWDLKVGKSNLKFLEWHV